MGRYLLYFVVKLFGYKGCTLYTQRFESSYVASLPPSVEVAEEVSRDLLPGDIVALATDGVFDNLFDNLLANKLAAFGRAGPGRDATTLQTIADSIIDYAL